jgi:hypothetical protein
MIRFTLPCHVRALSVSLLVLAGAAALAADSQSTGNGNPVAQVKRVQGETRVERGGASTPLQPGEPLQRQDNLKTGPGARLSLTFKDGTRLAIGENALLVIGDYVPEQGRTGGALILELHEGAIRLTAKEPAKAPDKRVEVRTPAGRITARAMDVWSGPIDGKVGVLLMDGRLDVRNDAGVVVLHKKKLGTMVAHHASAPERAVTWPAEKVNQALLSVAFK